MFPVEDADKGPLAVICGGGALPFAVAAAAAASGRKVVLFPLRGWAEPARLAQFPHHWIALGQFGRFMKLAQAERCRDVVWIGSLVRPAIHQLRFDTTTLRLLPRLIRGFRGGDDHLLTAVGSIFEDNGFRLVAAHDIAPQILVPEGALGRVRPNDRDRADIVRGLAILDAIGRFDVGQAAVVANRHCLAIEGIEGTDALLARVADLRGGGRLRAAAGSGVLVKAPKPGQDRRFDLPTIGPKTVEGLARAGLAGIAVLAGSAIMADTEQLIALADERGIFIAGVRADGTCD